MSKDRTLGQIFKDARLKKGLTQVEVAKKVGLHSNTVAKIEGERQVPEFTNAQTLAEVLGIPLSLILPFYRKS
jgi:transcriptional regulator with XRE-family HTH domain